MFNNHRLDDCVKSYPKSVFCLPHSCILHHHFSLFFVDRLLLSLSLPHFSVASSPENTKHSITRRGLANDSYIVVVQSLSCLTFCNPMDCSTTGFPFPSLSSGVCSNSCPLIQWCHPTISSSVAPFSSCPQSFPASRSFPLSQLFTSGVQRNGASASASVLPMNIQGWGCKLDSYWRQSLHRYQGCTTLWNFSHL